MKKQLDQRGEINAMVIPLVISIVLLFAAIGFGVWAFVSRSDYKNNSDKKAEAAAQIAVQKAETAKDNEFLEREKQPYKDYTGPVQFGNFGIKYPKTWSAYVNDTQTNTLTMLLQPDAVSANIKTTYAAKVEVLSQPYDQLLAQVDNDVKTGKATAVAYQFPKVPTVTGLRVDGQIAPDKRGAIVFMPLRDKTIKVSTETVDRINDFNNVILPNFTFSP